VFLYYRGYKGPPREKICSKTGVRRHVEINCKIEKKEWNLGTDYRRHAKINYKFNPLVDEGGDPWDHKKSDHVSMANFEKPFKRHEQKI